MTVDGYMGSYDALASLPFDSVDRVSAWRWASARALLASRLSYGLGIAELPSVFDGRTESRAHVQLGCEECAAQRTRMLAPRLDREKPSLTIMHLYFLHDGLTTDGRCVDEASEQETLDALSAFLEALRVKALEEAGGRRGVWILAGADQGWCAKGLPKNDAWRSVYSSRGAPTSWATEGIPDYPDALAEVLMMAFGAGREGVAARSSPAD